MKFRIEFEINDDGYCHLSLSEEIHEKLTSYLADMNRIDNLIEGDIMGLHGNKIGYAKLIND